jgi:hypothetical protein
MLNNLSANLTIFKLFRLLRSRLPWLNLPVTFLVFLLQKTPVLNLISLGDEAVPSLPAASILKSAFIAAASIGSVHTLVGASGIVTTPATLTATAGVASTGVVFTVAGADSAPKCWVVTGVLPPGMNFSGLTLAGTVNVTTSGGYATLTGTPSTAGTFSFSMIAYSEINAKGYNTNSKSYTVTVKAGTVSAPVITSSPPSTQTVALGSTLNLTILVSGTDATTYQWQLDGSNINGATASVLSISSVSAANAGSYTCVVTNSAGTLTSSPSSVIVSTPPVIVSSPLAKQSVAVGATVNLSVVASSPTAVNYQWQFNSVNIFGATASTLTLNSVTAANAGSYVCIVSNLLGIATSSPSVLSISPAGSPTITLNPSSQTISSGSTIVFKTQSTSALASTYQWYLNGVAIAGATSSTLFIPAATSANAGAYSCTVTNAAGSASTLLAQLTLLNTTNPGRLVNLSVLTMDGPGSQMLTLGFVNGGAGTTGTEPLLIRASGPALTAFGLNNVLADPTLKVLQGSNVVASNDNWGSTAANINAVNIADAATGAFALTPTTSLDAAVVQALPSVSGGYTVQVLGNGTGVGNALAEVYDNTANYTVTSPRLINLSCLQQVPVKGLLSAGFAISGATAKTVLIRASGPTLASFGVLGTMTDPQLNVFSGTTVIASNAGWGGDVSITAANSATGAFQFASASSKDSAVVMTLAPGSYTVQATSVSETAGVTMIEVYEVQ